MLPASSISTPCIGSTPQAELPTGMRPFALRPGDLLIPKQARLLTGSQGLMGLGMTASMNPAFCGDAAGRHVEVVALDEVGAIFCTSGAVGSGSASPAVGGSSAPMTAIRAVGQA